MRRSGWWSVLAIAAITGCASAPSQPDPASTRRQFVSVATYSVGDWIADDVASGAGRSWPGLFAPGSNQLPGAHCVAANDRGTWEITPPGKVEVELSTAPLRITCRRDGFRDSAVEIRCISPRDRATKQGALAGLQLVGAAGPAAALVLPGIGAAVALMAGSAVLGGAAGHAAGGPSADICIYAATREVEVRVLMQRSP